MMAYDSAAEGVSNMAGGAAGEARRTGIGALFREARDEVDAAKSSRSAETHTDTGRDKSGAHGGGSRTATASSTG